ncbi:conserved plasma membrane protein [Plakobranchus ocellatus]|uniref:Conserved plasma membrane protein n=1 Tax=Plakobranchus ocellatus TaxID=259542 RepID=A0AAV4DZN0_9GAST|nr:conserved plasma membrane protein [Plakobranchus ocellatus]
MNDVRMEPKEDRVEIIESGSGAEPGPGLENGDVQEAVPESPITFSSMGLPTTNRLQDTAMGKVRQLNDTSWQERIFFIMMLVSILAVLGFTIYRVATVDQAEPDFTFGLVLLLQAGFCLIYLIDGILRERPSEIFILCLATLVIAFYLVMNYAEGIQTDIKLVRLIVAICLAPFLIGMGLYIAWQYYVSKRIIFRTVGADATWQGMLQRLLIFQDMLKFDLQLGASMVILILVSGFDVSTRDIVVLAVGIPITFAWFLIGINAMPAESKPWAIVFAIVSPAEVGYIMYRFYKVEGYLSEKGGLASAVIICGSVALIIRVIVMILFVLIFQSFGKGLKEQIRSMKR